MVRVKVFLLAVNPDLGIELHSRTFSAVPRVGEYVDVDGDKTHRLKVTRVLWDHSGEPHLDLEKDNA